MSYEQINTSLDEFKRLLRKDDLEEDPVSLDEFVMDSYYLGLPPLSPIQTTIVEKMTQIYKYHTLEKIHGKEKAEVIWEDTVTEVIAMMGKGAGKDFSLRIAFARIIYLLHCLKDPLDYYGMGGGEYIDLLNIAVNSEQAQRVFFEPLKNLLINSPYFQSKGFNAMSKQVTFMDKPIRAFSGHSEAEGWEGYNLMAVALDEIAAFKNQEETGEAQNRFSAGAIYDMARLSVVSRFPDVGKVALLSFPRYEGDFMETRYESVIEESRKRKVTRQLKKIEIEWEEEEIIVYKEPRVWAIKAPTFISNPTKKPEDFEADFIRDPIGSYARILCVPPKMQEAYFRDPDRVRTCFHVHDISCMGDKCLKHPLDEMGMLDPTFEDKKGPPRYVHIDLGLKRDRSALGMVHSPGFVKNESGESLPIVRMDLIKYWEAPPKGEIDFEEVRRFLFELASKFNIVMITMDRWQSVDTKRIFQARGLYTEFMVVKKEHYDTLSTSIYDRRFEGYHDEILVEQELLKLQLQGGTKVDHPKKGFKDGADCMAGATYTCTKNTPLNDFVDIKVLGGGPEVPKKRLEEKKKEDPPPPMPIDLQEYVQKWRSI